MDKESREFYEKYFPKGYADEQEKLDKLVDEKFPNDYDSTDLLKFITDFWVNSNVSNNAKDIYWELVRDGGNFVIPNAREDGQVYLLLGAIVTKDDYYYLCLSRDVNIQVFSCVMGYKKVNIKNLSTLTKQQNDDILYIYNIDPELTKSLVEDYFNKNKNEILFTKLYGC